MSTKEIRATECRFVVHMPSKHPDQPDYHLVKERVHYADGTSEPKVTFLKDYKRPFWVTKRSCQNHFEKREWELLTNVDSYKCTESDLRSAVAKALGTPWSKDHLKQLQSSPYLYGTDMSSATLIKAGYMRRNPDILTNYTVAAFDVETDMIHGHEEIIMATLAMQNKCYTVVTKDYFKGIDDPQRRVDEAMETYLSDIIQKRNLNSELLIVETEIDILKAIFTRAHEWMPDIIAIWNIDFDITKLIKACERAKVDPKDILSDPRVPPDRRIFKYKQGPKKRVTASGKTVPINMANQWHTVISTSSFYFLDAMCCYKHIRLGKQELPSYSLDAILTKEIKRGKLKFDKADAYEKAKWHIFMQTYYKVEYVIYNRFDCIGMLELDEKTHDLESTIGVFSEYSEFSKFSSQPKRIADDLFFECLEAQKCVGTVGPSAIKWSYGLDTERFATEEEYQEAKENGLLDEEEEEGNNDILDLKGWIVTLPMHNTAASAGLCVIEEDPTMRTNIRCSVFDADSVSSYPSCTAAANVSKETTLREIIDVQGIPEYVFRMQNINCVSGHANALEYCTTMFNFPKPFELLSHYQATQR